MRIRRSLIAVASAAAIALAFAATSPAAAVSTRVVGGAPADIGAMPWMAYLTATSGTGSWACGGTVVAPDVVLTAAHCVVDRGRVVRAQAIRLVLGRTDLRNPGGVVTRSAAIAVDPLYDRHGKDEGGPHDAALVRLAAPLPPEYTPLRLATVADAPSYAAGAVARIAGWGLTQAGGSEGSPVLMSADLPIVASATCASEDGISPAEARQMVCAGLEAGGIDTCQGDSGGPLTVVSGSETVVAGIVSWGFECASARHPGVYTRVSAVEPWARALVAGDDAVWERAADNIAPRVRVAAVRGRAGGIVLFRYAVAGETGPTSETITIRRARIYRSLRTLRTAAAVNKTSERVAWRIPRRFAPGRYVWCVVSEDANGNRSTSRCARLRVAP